MSTDTTTTETTLPANFRYRDENGKMISREKAIAKRWAHKADGTPTKIYLLQLAKREAVKNGEEPPKRQKKTYEAGSQTHADVPSPYDLNRRSGYRTIWQVLAEHANEFVSVEDLHTEVNSRLAAEAPEWYGERYSDENPYDVEANAYVMTRAPYNAKIEAMDQRVVQEDEGFKLMTNVTTPRVLKKRGRKPKAQEAPAEPTVEADEDNAVTVTEQEAVTA